MRKISTLLRRNSFLLLSLSFFLSACSNSVTSQVPDGNAASSGQSSAAEAPQSAAQTPQNDTQAAVGPMADLYNAEMVMYCSQYPAAFTEDYDQNAYRGQHVFVGPDGKSKIVYSGNPTELSLPVLFERSVADVQAKSGAKISLQELGSDYLRIAWTEGQQQHDLYKWYRLGEGETVTVTFDYPESQSAQFEVWIAAMTVKSPDCQ